MDLLDSLYCTLPRTQWTTFGLPKEYTEVYLVIADVYEEMGMDLFAVGLRWLHKHGKLPSFNSDGWSWFNGDFTPGISYTKWNVIPTGIFNKLDGIGRLGNDEWIVWPTAKEAIEAFCEAFSKSEVEDEPA
jgi:hypothetical protein